MRTALATVLAALPLVACAGTTPAPRNPSPACRVDAPPPTTTSSPGWPCWPEGLGPDDGSLYVANRGVVAARPEAVWAWLTRPDLWSTWFPRATNVRVEQGPATLGVGSVVAWEMLGSTIRVTVTRAQAPYVLAWEGGASGVHAYHAWLLEPRGEATHVVTVETERGPVPAIAGFAYEGSLRAAHEEWIHGLARVARGDRMPGGR